MFRDYGICILDGFRECEEPLAQLLLTKLERLFAGQSGVARVHVRMLIVSREVSHLIPDTLSSLPHLRLENVHHEISHDLHLFIRTKTEGIVKLRRWSDRQLAQVRKDLQKRAEGTFLFVGIAIQLVATLKLGEVTDALKRISSHLAELYDQMLLQTSESRQ